MRVRRNIVETPPAWLYELALEEAHKPAGVTARELARISKQPVVACSRALLSYVRRPGYVAQVVTTYEPFKGGPADPIQVTRYSKPPNPSS